MNLTETIEFLREHPGYLKWGDRRLSDRIDTDIEIVARAKQTVKRDFNSGLDSHSVNTTKPIQKDSSVDEEEDREIYETLDEFLDARGIDRDDVTSVKHWQTMDGSPRFSVVTRNDETDYDYVQDIRDSLGEYEVPVFRPDPPERTSERCGVINLFDAHIDKISLVTSAYDATDNTLDENFEQLEQLFDELLAGLLDQGVEHIIFPVGSDFWTSNGTMNTTKKGTPQDVLVPHHTAFRRGLKFYHRAIDKAAQVAPKVTVVTLPGNHDEDPVHYLAAALDLYYEDDPVVEILDTEHQRKYVKYGLWGFGFGHGDKEKNKKDRLPMLFVNEGPEVWFTTTMREMFFGDIHHKREYRFERAVDGPGMYAYFLRSVNGNDKWHADQGYVGIPKTAEAFIYDKNTPRKRQISISW